MMLKYLLSFSGCLIGTLVAATALAQRNAPAGEELPFVGLPPPPELQVLAPLVGKWTTTTKLRPTLRQREEIDAKGEITVQWLHNRHFIRMEGFGAGTKYRLEFTVIFTYDPTKQVYRRWTFTSAGLAAESEGRWDDSAKTMTWKQVNLSADVTGSVKDVLAKDRFETAVFFKRNDGQVLADSTTTATRKKEPDK